MTTRQSLTKRKTVARARKEPDLTTYSGRFAARIRALRDKTGMSADEFAETHGFARATWYNWESGIRTPALEELPKIAKAFGIPVRTLIPPK